MRGLPYAELRYEGRVWVDCGRYHRRIRMARRGGNPTFASYGKRRGCADWRAREEIDLGQCSVWEFSHHGNDRGSSMARLKARLADEHRPHHGSDHRDPVRADLRRNPTRDQLLQAAGAAQPQARPATTRRISPVSTVLRLKTDDGR